MPNYTRGSTRVALQQPDLTAFQANGSVVLDSRRTRPLWFDGRFLRASDLDREQNYFLQREADLGQASGFGVMSGLMVERGSPNARTANAQTILVRAGKGITPAGEMVEVTSDLTIPLAELLVDASLDVQFGLSAAPAQPASQRSGLFVVTLRPVEFTANPITAYPTTVLGPRSSHDGDIVEATAVTLTAYPNPPASFAPSLQQAAIARQIFLSGNPSALPDSLLPLALVSVQQGIIQWVDPYLVRRDAGPQFSGVRFGLTDAAAQQAYLMQYDMQLQAAVAARQASGLKANFAATDVFLSLPAAGRFPLDGLDTSAFSQVFFPQQMDVRLSVVPMEEIPALLDDSLALPPIDLTLDPAAYANLAVFAFIPVPLANFAALKNSLPEIPLNPTLPQVLANRKPIELLRLYKGNVTFTVPAPVANSAWTNAVGSQKYGFYLRRKSDPTFVPFETPLNLVLSSAPDPSVEGQAVTFTVNVTPASATGNVEFMDGPNALGNSALASGVAALSTSSLSVGAHNVTAVYGGDDVNAANTSNVVVQTVTKALTTLAVASSANPSNVGQAVTFKAQVSPTSATGSVQFLDGAAVLSAQTLVAGSAAFTTSALALGSHSISASYKGDANFAGSTSAALKQSVVKASSSVALASSANPSTVGHAVTFTAAVTPNTATGSVQFMDGGTALGTGVVSGGVASFSTSALTVGAHSINATYGGDAATAASPIVSLAQAVIDVVSSVTVSSSANPSTVGQAVTFAARVTPNTATGTVKFSDAANALGTATLSGGAAALPPNSSLAIGAHSITAAYSGDSTNAPSASAPLVQTVNRVASTVVVNSSVNPSAVGQAINLTATVTPNTATGSVQFLDGASPIASAALASGVAALTGLTSLAPGAHSITAAYAGDANNGPGTSQAFIQTVNAAASSVALSSSANPSAFGQTVTFTVAVTPQTATGSITLHDGTATLATVSVTAGTGAASFSTAALAVGAHTVGAVYSGDANTLGSTSAAVVQTVNRVAATVALSSSVNPSGVQQAVTFTARISPGSATGNVQFMDGTAVLATVAVNGAVAVFSTSALAVGSHSITAVYTGDANDAPASSAPVTQTVNRVASTVLLVASPASARVGATVIFTVRVTPAAATGSVAFLDGGRSMGSAVLNGGGTTFETATLAVGTHSITAAYAGDANHDASVSAAIAETIVALIVGTLTIAPTSHIILQQTLTPVVTAAPDIPGIGRLVTDTTVTDVEK